MIPININISNTDCNKKLKHNTYLVSIINNMTKTSAELSQKAAGYMLAAANASKREMNEKKPIAKTTITKTTITKTTIIKPHFKK